ncbi:MAG: lytic transglycosylase [Comamonadaceae bacterium CG1_02_60_18]|nr:MAG: lytic transglycosylase [Comamonadaceae bacterium CG1_02_60_18]PIQ52887.1 MAG: lytic transglycosylase [Comamonadaceae bacterium CG12_big_fil_rev_8_21_14_0_65_59_15]
MLTRRAALSRSWLLWPLNTVLGASWPEQAQAGGQIEEPMADAVRNAMHAAVHDAAPPEPVFASTEARLHYLRWKIEMNRRLISRKTDLKTFLERDEFLQSVWYNCKRSRLDVDLVLGLIQVESNFRKRAISPVGARGYMQVMPFWMRLLEDGDVSKLFDLQTNLRFGCVILRHYLEREKGNLFLALGRYNGSRGKAAYPDAVAAAQRRWLHSATRQSTLN